MIARLTNSTAIARPSIFSALVGPRILLAPDDGGGNGGAGGGDGGGDAGGAGAGAGGGDGGVDGARDGAGGGAGAAGGGAAADAGDKPAGDKSLLAEALAGKDGAEAGAEPPAGDGDKPDGGEGGKGADAASDAGPKDVDGNPLPETYDIKMPDGFKMDEGLLAAAAPIFKEHRLSPAQAQAVADIYMQQQTKGIEAHTEMVATWAKEARADKEIGGAKFAENMGYARKAFEAFGTERVSQVLDTWGLGNNPEFLRMFVRIGKAISEGGTVLGGDGGGRVSAARDMYPSMNKGG